METDQTEVEKETDETKVENLWIFVPSFSSKVEAARS